MRPPLRMLAPALAATLALAGMALVRPAGAGAASSDESTLLSLTNAARAAAGVPALSLDAGLSSVARQWAQTMTSQDNISHNPDLKSHVPANWTKTGENVGMGASVDSIHQALLKSPHHYDNIVDPEFQRVGIGVLTANGTVWIVEDFLATAGAPAATIATSASAPALTFTVLPPPTLAPTTTTTTVPPPTTTTSTTTTTIIPPTPAPVLPLRLTQMVQQLQALRSRQ